MDSAVGSCNACGATSAALLKLSLGKDFFGRTYDRLSPSTDQSPKWYCEGCSMQKNLQRDFRDITAEIDKLAAGQASQLSKSDEFQRAALRVRENCRAARCCSEPFTAARERRGQPFTRTTQYHHRSSLTHDRSCLVINATSSSVRINGALTIPVEVVPSLDLKRSTPVSSRKRSGWI